MPTDLSPRWILVKVVLFVAIAALAGAYLVWQQPTWATVACLLALVWACCRIYYFLFHALQHWVDPTFRYRGLLELIASWWRRSRSRSD